MGEFVGFISSPLFSFSQYSIEEFYSFSIYNAMKYPPLFLIIYIRMMFVIFREKIGFVIIVVIKIGISLCGVKILLSLFML